MVYRMAARFFTAAFLAPFFALLQAEAGNRSQRQKTKRGSA
jgi:hypothetical protein